MRRRARSRPREQASRRSARVASPARQPLPPSGRSRPRPPRSRRDPGVDELQAALVCLLVPALRVAEVRVAAVDDRVALVGNVQQLLEDALGDVAGGNHHPERTRRLDSDNHSQIKVQQENRSNQSSLNRSVTPLSVDMNTFQLVIGWLNEYEILIYDFFDQQAHLSSYHVLTGETDEFLSIDDRIITAQLSPSRNYLFIHTSRSPYEAQLDIYDTPTKEKVSGTTINLAKFIIPGIRITKRKF